MICFPNAKINFGLQVLSKRTDGFHSIESILYPIPLHDILEIIPSTTFSFESSGIKIPGDPNSNLCVKAYHLLRKNHPISPVAIHLHKKIPIGAGLGGGSSDGSHVLKTLNTLFDLQLNTKELIEYAEILGADCPFFIKNTPQYITGKGEIMEDIEISLKGKWLLLVDSGIHISTEEAFSYVKPNPNSRSLKKLIQNNISEWKNTLINDFQKPVFTIYPELQGIYQEMCPTSLYTSLSGSGSSVFGIFEQAVNLNLGKYKTHWMELK